MMTSPLHVRAETAPEYLLREHRFRMLTTGEQTGGSYSVMRIVSPQGTGAGLHVHEAAEEHFLVLAGAVEFTLAGRPLTAHPGDLVHIPRGTSHGFTISTDTATMVATFTPAGEEHFFLADATPVERQPAKAIVLQPGEGRTLDLGAFAMTVKADSADTDGWLTLLEATEPADFGPPLHIHHDAAEAFYVLAGEYLVVIDDVQHRCPAGTFVFVPAGIVHGFRVGAVPSRKLNLYLPAAMVGYFDELATGAQAFDPSLLTAMAARYAMEVRGPVPPGYV